MVNRFLKAPVGWNEKTAYSNAIVGLEQAIEEATQALATLKASQDYVEKLIVADCESKQKP